MDIRYNSFASKSLRGKCEFSLSNYLVKVLPFPSRTALFTTEIHLFILYFCSYFTRKTTVWINSNVFKLAILFMYNLICIIIILYTITNLELIEYSND